MRRASDRWISLSLSVLLHGALLGALVYGWLLFRRPPHPEPSFDTPRLEPAGEAG